MITAQCDTAFDAGRTLVPRRPHRVVEHRPDRVCQWCCKVFTPLRCHARWCSGFCRREAWRARRFHYALIVWDRHLHSHFLYFASRAEAYAAAPADIPWSVVDIAAKPRPNDRQPVTIHEIVNRTRSVEVPWPDHCPRRPVHAGGTANHPPAQKRPSAAQGRANTPRQPATSHPWRHSELGGESRRRLRAGADQP